MTKKFFVFFFNVNIKPHKQSFIFGFTISKVRLGIITWLNYPNVTLWDLITKVKDCGFRYG